MKKLKLILVMLLFSAYAFSQINITVKTPPYVNPATQGEYPNATLEYIGDVHDSFNKTFSFVFALIASNGKLITIGHWSVSGTTDIANTIKNHGQLKRGSDAETDFISYVTGGGDLNDPLLVVIEQPELSYDDIINYFILGGKLDKVQLPVNANAQKLIKWMLLNQLNINGELLVVQFKF